MNVSNIIEQVSRLLKEHRYDDAQRLLTSAIQELPKEELLWEYLVYVACCAGKHEEAVEFAKQAIRYYPHSDWLWQNLGRELILLGRLDEAEKALNNAKSLNPNESCLWRYFAWLHQKRKEYGKEIEALENLHALGEADANELNSLGIAYYNQGNFAKALKFYQLSVAAEPSAVPLFNMGVVYNHPEVSQDADAADAYRRALLLDPSDEDVQKRLEATKKRLIPLAQRARASASDLIRPEEYFQFYVNPYEVLQLDKIKSLENLDIKAIQRAKKILLQEIELNESKVSWLGDYPLDKSIALALEDELYDEDKRLYHWAVFQNQRLLRFITRGDIEHFLYTDDYFPQETLELLEEEPEFCDFLSKPFARQYNLVLTRAIERRALSVVEVLFDGRRWVKPEDEDICFKGAIKWVNEIVEQMRELAEKGKTSRVDLEDIEDFLDNNSVVELFNLLPTAFRTLQSRLVGYIRSLAIACHNEHGDTELSAAVLELCKLFHFKGAELNKQLEEDFEAIKRIIDENRKHSFSAWIHPNQALVVTQTGIKYKGLSISPGDIEGIRWGIFVKTVNGIETERSFSLVVRGDGTTLPVEWNKRGLIAAAKSLFRHKDNVVSVAEMSSNEQEVFFQKMIDAVIHHLLPALVTKLVERLQNGEAVAIGPCTLTQEGIVFRTGLIFRKDILLPWADVETKMHSGEVIVFSRTNRKAQVSMSAKDTDNAVVLPIICAAMSNQSN
ncbi:MAG: tetratricopeptide repeat protein [Bacillota bacterium]